MEIFALSTPSQPSYALAPAHLDATPKHMLCETDLRSIMSIPLDGCGLSVACPCFRMGSSARLKDNMLCRSWPSRCAQGFGICSIVLITFGLLCLDLLQVVMVLTCLYWVCSASPSLCEWDSHLPGQLQHQLCDSRAALLCQH